MSFFIPTGKGIPVKIYDNYYSSIIDMYFYDTFST